MHVYHEKDSPEHIESMDNERSNISFAWRVEKEKLVEKFKEDGNDIISFSIVVSLNQAIKLFLKILV
jgi:hypothetical protein